MSSHLIKKLLQNNVYTKVYRVNHWIILYYIKEIKNTNDTIIVIIHEQYIAYLKCPTHVVLATLEKRIIDGYLDKYNKEIKKLNKTFFHFEGKKT